MGTARSRKQVPETKPTFDGDYDFESANAKFDKSSVETELQQQLNAMSVGGGVEAPVEGVPEVKPPTFYYNPSGSFFDNLGGETRSDR